MSEFRAQSLSRSESQLQIDNEAQKINSSSKKSSPIKKKSVTFSPDTYFSDEYTIFVNIANHGYLKDAGHTIYTIKMIFRGREWSFVKRYRDFENLHYQLLKESNNSEVKKNIPNLPQKRWFETGRWINRHDKEYGMKRRLALEEYLRALVKIPWLKKVSYALHEFVNSEDTELFTPEDMIYFEDYEKEKKKRWWADDDGILYEILNFDSELVGNEPENRRGDHTESRGSIYKDFDSNRDTSSNSSSSSGNKDNKSSGDSNSSESDHHKASDKSEDSPTNSQDSQNSNEEIRIIQEEGHQQQQQENPATDCSTTTPTTISTERREG